MFLAQNTVVPLGMGNRGKKSEVSEGWGCLATRITIRVYVQVQPEMSSTLIPSSRTFREDLSEEVACISGDSNADMAGKGRKFRGDRQTHLEHFS